MKTVSLSNKSQRGVLLLAFYAVLVAATFFGAVAVISKGKSSQDELNIESVYRDVRSFTWALNKFYTTTCHVGVVQVSELTSNYLPSIRRSADLSRYSLGIAKTPSSVLATVSLNLDDDQLGYAAKATMAGGVVTGNTLTFSRVITDYEKPSTQRISSIAGYDSVSGC